MSWIWGSSQLDDAVDKATSELLPAGGEDIALNLEICDQIRSKSVPAKEAMRALKRRLNHKNPNVQLLALSLTDICVKNGGDLFLSEVASREFMDNLVSILKIPALNHDVKQNILRFIQNWSIAFEGKPNLSYVGQVYKTLTSEGYKFPPKDLAVANSAMVDTQTAPEWADSDICLRCRTPFSFTNRKHHCRNCGQVFDQACSSKTMVLPHFGITQAVRVCDTCHTKFTKKAEKAVKAHRHSSSNGHRHKSARELADAELQRAIQLSLEEVHGASGRSRSGYVPSQPSGYSEPPIIDRSTYPSRAPATADDDDDPELKAAIEASLREASAPKPSAPIVAETPRSEYASYPYAASERALSYTPASETQPTLPKLPNYDLEPLEADAILTFNQTVDQVQAQGGRDLSRYPAVNELYERASGLRPKLALSLDDAGRKEQMLTDMHDKLSQAVKLYDQILTQQVAQPRWRAPAAVSPSPYQQQPAYNQYSQWTPQPSQSAYQPYQPASEPQEMSARATYASPPPAMASVSDAPAIQQQYQQQQPYQQFAQQPQHTHYGSSPMNPAPSASPQVPHSPPSQSQYQQYTASAPPQSPANMYHQPASIAAPMQYASPPPPPSAQPQSPPPPAQYQQHAPHAPPLQAPVNDGRQNTVSQPNFVPQQYHVTPQHEQQQRQPQQQPQQSYQGVAHPPTSLPQFPSAPTTLPQPVFPAYGSSISPGFEKKEERKEALLIDL